MIYMFCYDISNAKRLRKVAKILENYGMRVQKSFFQCDMDKSSMDELKNKLLKLINKRKDSLFIYPLCEDCVNRVIKDGKGDIIKLESYEII